MKQRGFTLIELVIVIIILGILAVVAAPKFINLKHDALTETIVNMQGQLKSANDLVFSRAAVAGKENLEYSNIHNPVDSSLIIDGKRVDLHYGHIQPSSANIDGIMHIDDADWTVVSTPGIFGQAYMTPRGAPAFGAKSTGDIDKSQCFLKYSFDRAHYQQPSYEVNTAGC
ncbi:prepilin-type N-terminal cleavage/methylation domain-containing protein [Shewanella sp. GXUN23E]|uniref:prepilin-type N-terminal cleavage/methylation domain-containing protein n=1 Tax=Shewanella sp. GXUN23E TaxID=3422498 RepID=UPI003D7DE6A6